MSIQKVEMTVEQKENGQYVEQVAYPYVEYECVTMENGMDIMSMIRDDVSMPMVTHDTTSWKVGQGDSDVSETIVDSSVGDMTIKGQTYQNILPSPSLRNSMTNGKTMQKLNEGYDSVNTVDGVCKSAILKGQTLVNLLETEKEKYTFNNQQNWVVEDGYLKCNGTSSWHTVTDKFNDMIKPSTKYLLRIEIVENTLDMILNFDGYGTNIPQSSAFLAFAVNEVGVKSHIVTTAPELDSTKNGLFRLPINITNGGTLKIRFMAIEYQEGMENWDIPYFEGMQSVKVPVLTTTGKNLFDVNKGREFVYNRVPFTKFDGSVYTIRVGSVDSVEIENDSIILNNITYANTVQLQTKHYVDEGVTYNISIINESGTSIRVRGITYYNQYGEILGGYWDRIGEITPPKGCNYLIVGYTCELGNGRYKIQFEQGTTATPYEPYKSNILSTPSDLELRGIGDVQDELDLLTGELTERVGEVVLNGGENWATHSYGYCLSASHLGIYHRTTSNAQVANNFVADSVPTVSIQNLSTLTIDGIAPSHRQYKEILLFVKEVGKSNLNGLKQWLSQNPITVQYELATESIKTVDLSILNQDNQPTTQLNSFANGYIQVLSQEGTLIPTTEYEVPTSNSYYVDLMKPNTQYTMKNIQGTFTIDNIQYNASTNGTFTSPSTLSNRLMITNVAQTQPMLLEGDMTSKEVPYVEGNKSAFEGVDKVEIYSVGKNLFDAYKYEFDTSSSPGLRVEVLSSNSIRTYCTDTIAWRSASVIYRLKPHTWYNIRCEASGNGVKQIDINIPEYGSSWNPNTVSCSQSNNMLGKFLTDESGKVKLGFQGSGSENISYDNTYTNIQIEEIQEKNVVHTYYEPYKSNTTSFQLPHPLRSLPNGVRDEIVLDRVNHKAKIIQRVGEDLTQLDTPIITEVNLEGYPYVYKGGHIFLNTEIAPTTEVTYSINQAHQIESSNEDILRHQKEINHLYELIAQYVQVQYEAELIDIALQG